jgi:uncharacterized cupin superfamily protein
MPATGRPACITHWRDIEQPDNSHYPDDPELMSIGAPFGKHFALQQLGIHHERLLPGRRTSFPHAESSEEEFVYVIAGTPEVWLDGHVHRLQPGDGVGFPAGTGLAHTFINNTEAEVHLLVVGERTKPDNRIVYPLHTHRRGVIPEHWWDDAPARPLGLHDGMSDAVRAQKAGTR